MTPSPWLLTIVLVFGSLLSIALILFLMWNEKKRERELAVAQVRGADRQERSVAQVIREEETMTKEVVMIPCKYCGGLMPQTSIFCPNCGARKRSA